MRSRLAVRAYAAFAISAAVVGASQYPGSWQPVAAATDAVRAPTRTVPPSPGKVTVFAAASLSEAFRAIARGFEQTNPGVEVELNFAGSPALVRQILEGAAPDVFAAADETSMQTVREAGQLGGETVIFARNSLAIAAEPGNPKQIAGLADLARSDVVVALCAPTVPAGRYAREAFQRAGLDVPNASQEIDVRAALTKVELGEADAAVVYVTDVKARAAHVAAVSIPDEHNVVARYPIARIAGAAHETVADAFIRYVLSADGQRALSTSGFRGP